MCLIWKNKKDSLKETILRNILQNNTLQFISEI